MNPAEQYAPHISSRNYPINPRQLAPLDTMSLFHLYKETGNVEYRNAILTDNMRKLRALCAGYAKETNVPADELLQEAVKGFLIGIDTYDIAKAHTPRGVAQVSSHAYSEATYALFDYFEQYQSLVRVSTRGNRALAKANKRLPDAIKEYGTDRIPLDALLDDHGRSARHGAVLLATRSFTDPCNVDIADRGAPRDSVRDWDVARAAVQLLPEPNRTIVIKYYELADNNPRKFAAFCLKQGIDTSYAERIVQASLKRIRKAIAIEDNSKAIGSTRTTRIFPTSKQIPLFRR